MIQGANLRALKGGVTTDGIFGLVRELRLDVKVPAIDDAVKEMEEYFEQQKASGSGPPVE